MNLLCIHGTPPGPIIASVTHGEQIRQIPVMLERHPNGGWHVALPDGGYGPRCHSVDAAILLLASETLPEPITEHAVPA